MPSALKKSFLVAGLLSCLPLFCFQAARADDEPAYREIQERPASKTASLFLTPIKDRIDGRLVVDLVVEPRGEEINAVETEISYDTSKLRLMTVGHEDSFCQFFIEEDMSRPGKVKLSCVAPFPGISEARNAYTLTFEQLDLGETIIDLSSESMVLANDGYGTNIAREIKGQVVTLER